MDLWFISSDSKWAKKENMIKIRTNNDFINHLKDDQVSILNRFGKLEMSAVDTFWWWFSQEY